VQLSLLTMVATSSTHGHRVSLGWLGDMWVQDWPRLWGLGCGCGCGLWAWAVGQAVGPGSRFPVIVLPLGFTMSRAGGRKTCKSCHKPGQL
jgi:hypothetical protein